MGIASGMRDLAQNIASSRQDRAKRLGEIKEETSQTREEAKDLIKGFQACSKELRAELKEASAAWRGLTSAKAKKTKEGGLRNGNRRRNEGYSSGHCVFS